MKNNDDVGYVYAPYISIMVTEFDINNFIRKYIIVNNIKYWKFAFKDKNIDNLPVAKIICKLEKI